MLRFKNVSEECRIWPSLQCDGRTLALEAGQEVELDLPDGFDDPYLKPVKPLKAKPTEPAAEPEKEL